LFGAQAHHVCATMKIVLDNSMVIYHCNIVNQRTTEYRVHERFYIFLAAVVASLQIRVKSEG